MSLSIHLFLLCFSELASVVLVHAFVLTLCVGSKECLSCIPLCILSHRLIYSDCSAHSRRSRIYCVCCRHSYFTWDRSAFCSAALFHRTTLFHSPHLTSPLIFLHCHSYHTVLVPVMSVFVFGTSINKSSSSRLWVMKHVLYDPSREQPPSYRSGVSLQFFFFDVWCVFVHRYTVSLSPLVCPRYMCFQCSSTFVQLTVTLSTLEAPPHIIRSAWILSTGRVVGCGRARSTSRRLVSMFHNLDSTTTGQTPNCLYLRIRPTTHDTTWFSFCIFIKILDWRRVKPGITLISPDQNKWLVYQTINDKWYSCNNTVVVHSDLVRVSTRWGGGDNIQPFNWPRFTTTPVPELLIINHRIGVWIPESPKLKNFSMIQSCFVDKLLKLMRWVLYRTTYGDGYAEDLNEIECRPLIDLYICQ